MTSFVLDDHNQPFIPYPCSIIVIRSNGKDGKSYNFSETRQWCTIGSHEECDIRLASKGIAPIHALIKLTATGVVIQATSPNNLIDIPRFNKSICQNQTSSISDDEVFLLGNRKFRISYELPLQRSPTPSSKSKEQSFSENSHPSSSSTSNDTVSAVSKNLPPTTTGKTKESINPLTPPKKPVVSTPARNTRSRKRRSSLVIDGSSETFVAVSADPNIVLQQLAPTTKPIVKSPPRTPPPSETDITPPGAAASKETTTPRKSSDSIKTPKNKKSSSKAIHKTPQKSTAKKSASSSLATSPKQSEAMARLAAGVPVHGSPLTTKVSSNSSSSSATNAKPNSPPAPKKTTSASTRKTPRSKKISSTSRAFTGHPSKAHVKINTTASSAPIRSTLTKSASNSSSSSVTTGSPSNKGASAHAPAPRTPQPRTSATASGTSPAKAVKSVMTPRDQKKLTFANDDEANPSVAVKTPKAKTTPTLPPPVPLGGALGSPSEAKKSLDNLSSTQRRELIFERLSYGLPATPRRGEQLYPDKKKQKQLLASKRKDKSKSALTETKKNKQSPKNDKEQSPSSTRSVDADGKENNMASKDSINSEVTSLESKLADVSINRIEVPSKSSSLDSDVKENSDPKDHAVSATNKGAEMPTLSPKEEEKTMNLAPAESVMELKESVEADMAPEDVKEDRSMAQTEKVQESEAMETEQPVVIKEQFASVDEFDEATKEESEAPTSLSEETHSQDTEDNTEEKEAASTDNMECETSKNFIEEQPAARNIAPESTVHAKEEISEADSPTREKTPGKAAVHEEQEEKTIQGTVRPVDETESLPKEEEEPKMDVSQDVEESTERTIDVYTNALSDPFRHSYAPESSETPEDAKMEEALEPPTPAYVEESELATEPSPINKPKGEAVEPEEELEEPESMNTVTPNTQVVGEETDAAIVESGPVEESKTAVGVDAEATLVDDSSWIKEESGPKEDSKNQQNNDNSERHIPSEEFRTEVEATEETQESENKSTEVDSQADTMNITTNTETKEVSESKVSEEVTEELTEAGNANVAERAQDELVSEITAVDETTEANVNLNEVEGSPVEKLDEIQSKEINLGGRKHGDMETPQINDTTEDINSGMDNMNLDTPNEISTKTEAHDDAQEQKDAASLEELYQEGDEQLNSEVKEEVETETLEDVPQEKQPKDDDAVAIVEYGIGVNEIETINAASPDLFVHLLNEEKKLLEMGNAGNFLSSGDKLVNFDKLSPGAVQAQTIGGMNLGDEEENDDDYAPERDEFADEKEDDLQGIDQVQLAAEVEALLSEAQAVGQGAGDSDIAEATFADHEDECLYDDDNILFHDPSVLQPKEQGQKIEDMKVDKDNVHLTAPADSIDVIEEKIRTDVVAEDEPVAAGTPEDRPKEYDGYDVDDIEMENAEQANELATVIESDGEDGQIGNEAGIAEESERAIAANPEEKDMDMTINRSVAPDFSSSPGDATQVIDESAHEEMDDDETEVDDAEIDEAADEMKGDETKAIAIHQAKDTPGDISLQNQTDVMDPAERSTEPNMECKEVVVNENKSEGSHAEEDVTVPATVITAEEAPEVRSLETEGESDTNIVDRDTGMVVSETINVMEEPNEKVDEKEKAESDVDDSKSQTETTAGKREQAWTKEELEIKNVKQLRALLKEKELSCHGKKSELIERLLTEIEEPSEEVQQKRNENEVTELKSEVVVEDPKVKEEAVEQQEEETNSQYSPTDLEKKSGTPRAAVLVKMKVKELQDLLREKGLPTHGLKRDLIMRLVSDALEYDQEDIPMTPAKTPRSTRKSFAGTASAPMSSTRRSARLSRKFDIINEPPSTGKSSHGEENRESINAMLEMKRSGTIAAEAIMQDDSKVNEATVTEEEEQEDEDDNGMFGGGEAVEFGVKKELEKLTIRDLRMKFADYGVEEPPPRAKKYDIVEQLVNLQLQSEVGEEDDIIEEDDDDEIEENEESEESEEGEEIEQATGEGIKRELQKLTVKALRQKLVEHEEEVPTKMKKDELVEKLMALSIEDEKRTEDDLSEEEGEEEVGQGNSKMNVKELRTRLEEEGLCRVGSKTVLSNRLEQFLNGAKVRRTRTRQSLAVDTSICKGCRGGEVCEFQL